MVTLRLNPATDRKLARLAKTRRTTKTAIAREAVHKLNGDPVKMHNCAPVDAMYKTDVSNPVWLKSSIVPADWEAPK